MIFTKIVSLQENLLTDIVFLQGEDFYMEMIFTCRSLQGEDLYRLQYFRAKDMYRKMVFKWRGSLHGIDLYKRRSLKEKIFTGRGFYKDLIF